MHSADAAKISFGSKTIAAMILALVVYTLVVYFVVVAVTVSAGALLAAVDWSAAIARPSIIQLIAVVPGAVAGMWAARLACDMALDAYLPRAVFYMFAVVLVATAIAKMAHTHLHAQSIIMLAQLFASAIAGYAFFWPQRSPVEIAKGLIDSD